MGTARRRTQRANRTATKAATQNAGAAAATLEAEEARVGKKVDWESEMKYINKDLRELLIISASLFALLFVVGFFL
jgi:hypothetical protein